MASCEDGDLCTKNDTCFGGVCKTGSPLACPALDDIATSQARPVAGTAEALGAEITKAVEAGPLPREPDSL